MRTPLIFGSKDKVEHVAGYYAEGSVSRRAPLFGQARSPSAVMLEPQMGAKMSIKHPIIAITGSSGAGTTSVKMTFEQIFRREKINAVYIEGDAFHRWNRLEMREQMKEAAAPRRQPLQPLRPRGQSVRGARDDVRRLRRNRRRAHAHLYARRARGGAAQLPAGNLHALARIRAGLRPAVLRRSARRLVTDKVNVAQYVDLKIGVVPVINLEWIQKLHRDKASRGYSTEAVTDTILRRMPDYINYICPQFTKTDINFQRVPTVDTSNPFIARWIPTPDESMVVIRFRDPHGIDFPYLLSMIDGSFMSRANSIVIQGGKLDIAMQLILTPMILKLVERRRRALRA